MDLSRRSILLSAVSFAQDQNATFSSEVKVVTLLAAVRNAEGQVVTNLSKEDFSLEEDGHPQAIRYFSRQSDLPLTIGLLVDTSKSEVRVLEAERLASYRFLDKVLRPDQDRAFVAHFDMSFGILQGLTPSRQELASALAKLKIPAMSGTLLYTGLKRSSERIMQGQTGRKAFILLSDGLDFRSRTSLGTAIEYAQRADTIIFSILFSDPRGQNRLGSKVMQRLAKETGGRCFEISDDNPLDHIFSQIDDELRYQYSLGYVSDQVAPTGKFRRIKLTTKYAALHVQTRDGYYPN
jgi:VWFA-related protein